jgi:hypothetical protein
MYVSSAAEATKTLYLLENDGAEKKHVVTESMDAKVMWDMIFKLSQVLREDGLEFDGRLIADRTIKLINGGKK